MKKKRLDVHKIVGFYFFDPASDVKTDAVERRKQKTNSLAVSPVNVYLESINIFRELA